LLFTFFHLSEFLAQTYQIQSKTSQIPRRICKFDKHRLTLLYKVSRALVMMSLE
jgi:hypothetical protein